PASRGARESLGRRPRSPSRSPAGGCPPAARVERRGTRRPSESTTTCGSCRRNSPGRAPGDPAGAGPARGLRRRRYGCLVRVRAVLEIGRQDFVTRLETDRAGRDVDARTRVRDEDEIVGVGADVVPERRPRLCEQPLEAAGEEKHRLPLELELPLLVALEDGS